MSIQLDLYLRYYIKLIVHVQEIIRIQQLERKIVSGLTNINRKKIYILEKCFHINIRIIFNEISEFFQ